MRRLRAWRRDGGFTLAELLVAIAIFAVVTSIVTTVIVSLNRTVRKETGFVDAQAQTRMAFETLDTQVRYASSVYDPSTSADGSQWIDWEVPDASLAAPGLRCYQWKSSPSAGTLQYRSWIVPASGSVTLPSWSATYTGLVAGAVPVFTTSLSDLAASPYNLPSAASSASASPSATADVSAAPASTQQPTTPQEPEVGVTLTVAANTPTGTSATSTVFTALNATQSPASPSCSSYVARS